MNHKSRRIMNFWALFTGPALWWGTVLLVPYVLMLSVSFYSRQFPFHIPDFQFGNYALLLQDSQYYDVLLRSLKISLAVSVCAFLLSYPLAYFLAFKVRSGRLRLFLYAATIVPLWVSYLLRAYTWKTILGSEGILNSFLMWIGLIDEPSTILLYNQGAMVVTMAYIFTPFMVMPIYASLEKIPTSLIEASKDLGAGRFRTFLKITLPLSIPGVLAGFTFTFGLSIGDFISPVLVGGPYSNMISNVIATQFGMAMNWPLGSALGVVLLFIVLGIITASDKLERVGRLNLG
ncbi:MAG: ABC transporter permease [Alphaproteobacteria bacterium]|jgi:spermidine/putrescine transport system permease protein|nr:ABC transporter permease [Rhodospirillaceae bacterium]MBT6206167.1 ABC transporter permease [Rhodospirillaceae bacterium]MBT7614221.1 ABC transporter permease [Rhodospirillaceae bacterium]MBT7646609.1 ABC transporter permease [Rhodospirillaceae bacterium]MDG2482888.1 ABC transporter permease [Alphaproteobacteria bacterium]